ncbi:MAG: DUF2752 domain-containing protein [Bacteroidia bacterium]|nr:MAG: DUF2752 domain-containing protein [Bacteroidia bacterium]
MSVQAKRIVSRNLKSLKKPIQALMTPWIRKSNYVSEVYVRFRNEPYLIINVVLAGVILLVFAYSGFFSPVNDNYPVVCIHEKLTGQPCVSCGLSHSFSLILRGRLSEAYDWNIYGLRVFIFFAAQLLMRIVFSIFYLKYPDTNKQLVTYDICISIMLFVVCFLPYFEWIFKSLGKIL